MTLSSIIHRIAQQPLRILLISGSPRSEENCPDEKSKSTKICEYLIANAPQGTVIDFLDLAVNRDIKVQPCKGCVSTAAPHCHYRVTKSAHGCSCYDPGSSEEPDLMHNMDVYRRLEACAGFILVTPVNWYAVPSQVKAMFDRLVCANGGNPYYELTEKDKKRSRVLEVMPEWSLIHRNHLENRSAAFFVYADAGADEMGTDGYPKILKNRKTFIREEEWDVAPPRRAVEPIIQQLRYSGINVENEHVVAEIFGDGMTYGVNNLTFSQRTDIFSKAFQLMSNFISYVSDSIIQNPPSNPEMEQLQDSQKINFVSLKERIDELAGK